MPPAIRHESYSVTELAEGPVLAPNETVLSGPIRILLEDQLAGLSLICATHTDLEVSNEELVLSNSCLDGDLVHVSEPQSQMHDLLNTTEHIQDQKQTESKYHTYDEIAQTDKRGISQSLCKPDDIIIFGSIDPDILAQTDPTEELSDTMSLTTAQDFVDRIQDLNGYKASEIQAIARDVTDILNHQSCISDTVNSLVEKQESYVNNIMSNTEASKSSVDNLVSTIQGEAQSKSTEMQNVVESVTSLEKKIVGIESQFAKHFTNQNSAMSAVQYRIRQNQETTRKLEKATTKISDELSDLNFKVSSLETQTVAGLTTNNPNGVQPPKFFSQELIVPSVTHSNNLTSQPLQITTATTPSPEEQTAIGLSAAYVVAVFLVPGPTIALTFIACGGMCLYDAIRHERPSSLLFAIIGLICIAVGLIVGLV